MSNIIEIEGLVKKYNGRDVLRGVDLTLEKGKILGILGPNGQGKTTLLNVIAGLLKADGGSVRIDDISVGYETKKIVSYLQEKNALYKWMKIKDIIEFYSDFFQDFNKEKMCSLLKFMKLEENMMINSLSKGMCEKLNLSLTLSRNCKLYILDEPISGVDPVTREKIIQTIIDKIDGEASMIITTHYVDELERILDSAVFLGDGIIVEQGEIDELRGKYGLSLDGIYRKVFAE